ncbi:MAG: transketolase [Desulfobacca sp. RBG_16_60_12]|nr:MAG: transketolase [Desulfobacca sp. RBG_16_60_12]
MPENIALRDAYGRALVELGNANPQVVVLDADLALATRTSMFHAAHPSRFFDIGIAEQNMMGIAAGMATMGLIPFANTLACFASKRATDQIRIAIAQPKLNVKIAGGFSGLLAGKTGKTHQSVQDIAIMRSMPNMVVLVPGDGVEAAAAVWAAVEYDGPVYMRLTRDPSPVIFDDSYKFQIGRGVVLREGQDVTIVTTGLMGARALEAADELIMDGIKAHVLHMPTVKPMDEEALVAAARRTGLVVTAEEHNILGGLGGAVAEILGEKGPTLMRRVGLKDTYAESGSNEALLEKYGLTARHIARACRDVVTRRGTIEDV